MYLRHVALASASEQSSDIFFQDLLGLKKANPKTLSSHLSRQIFNMDVEYKIINYMNDEIHFEIFIDGQKRHKQNPIEHVCLEVDDLEVFLEKCRTLDVIIRQIPKGEKIVTFVEDYDGNLFELQERR